MRHRRKLSEQRSIDALKAHLSRQGKKVSEDHEIIDKPDALLVVDGVRVAVECRIISPQKLMEFHNIKDKVNDLYMFFLPREPHLWIKHAIAEKASKKKAYKNRTCADEVWLIAHVGGMGPRVGKLEPSWEIIGYTYGVYISSNPFERVFIIDEVRNNVICLYSHEKGYCVKEIDRLEFPPENKIPIEIQFFSRMIVERLDNGNLGLKPERSLNNPDERLCLPPIATNYKADYSIVESLNFSNIGKGNKFPELYAYKIEQSDRHDHESSDTENK